MQTEDHDGAVLETWDADEVAETLENGTIVLIDVRTPQEFMFEHIEGALLMPMAFFTPGTLPDQQGKRIVLHCGSGMRSQKMAEICLEAGFMRIAHLGGGFGKWKEAGRPYIGTDMGSGAPKRVNVKG